MWSLQSVRENGETGEGGRERKAHSWKLRWDVINETHNFTLLRVKHVIGGTQLS